VSVWSASNDGHFAIDDFQPGAYLMWAQKSDRATYPPLKVTIEPDTHDPIDVELKTNHVGALVIGEVWDDEGHPRADLRVELEPRWPLALPIPLGGETTQGGKFSVDGLMPGRYEIVVRQGSRTLPIVRGPRDVEVPTDESEEVQLEGRIEVRI
jgi:hypothetical protein